MPGMATTAHCLPTDKLAQERVGPLSDMASIKVGHLSRTVEVYVHTTHPTPEYSADESENHSLFLLQVLCHSSATLCSETSTRRSPVELSLKLPLVC